MRLQPRGSVGAKGRAEPSTGNENAKKKNIGRGSKTGRCGKSVGSLHVLEKLQSKMMMKKIKMTK